MTDDELAALKRQVGELADRHAIRDCIMRECNGRDRQDEAMIASCWWEDGKDEHGAYIHLAPDYPARANAGHRSQFLMTSHNLTNHLCDLDGDTAHCQNYVMGALFWKDGKTTTLAMGRYLDRLEKRNGEWRLLVRRCTIEATADCDASWIYSDAIKGFLRAKWDGSDPCYDTPYTAQPKEVGDRW